MSGGENESEFVQVYFDTLSRLISRREIMTVSTRALSVAWRISTMSHSVLSCDRSEVNRNIAGTPAVSL